MISAKAAFEGLGRETVPMIKGVDGEDMDFGGSAQALEKHSIEGMPNPPTVK